MGFRAWLMLPGSICLTATVPRSQAPVSSQTLTIVGRISNRHRPATTVATYSLSRDLEAQVDTRLGFRDMGFDCYTTASPAVLLAAVAAATRHLSLSCLRDLVHRF